jgi:hypothetical protein
MLFILIFLFLLSSPLSFIKSPVYADDFDVTGQSRYNLYRHATAISVNYIPESKDAPLSFLYDVGDLMGTQTQVVLENESVHTITDANYRGRIPDLFDSVSGPPGTKVAVVYSFFNNAGHSIDVSEILVPFSKEHPELGNWLNIITVDGSLPIERTVSVLYDFRWIIKTAFLKEYIGPGVLEDQDEGSLVLDTLTISNPIKIEDIEIQELGGENGLVQVSVRIINESEDVLEDMVFEHYSYSLVFTISSLEELIIEYTLEGFEQLGYFKIYNPNLKTECAMYGNPRYQWFWGGGVTVIAYREDGGWVLGPIVQPEGEYFCISRIPYTMTSPHLGYANIKEDDNIERGEDEDLEAGEEIYSEQGEVLGVTSEGGRGSRESKDSFVLPKTGVVR